jgi:hypothetical protein
LADHRKKGQEEGINRPNLVDLSSQDQLLIYFRTVPVHCM